MSPWRLRLLVWVMVGGGAGSGCLVSEARAAAISSNTIQWQFSLDDSFWGFEGKFETEGRVSDLWGTGTVSFPVGRLLELNLVNHYGGSREVYRWGSDWSMKLPIVEGSGDIENLSRAGVIDFDRDGGGVLVNSIGIWMNFDPDDPGIGFSQFFVNVEPSGEIHARLEHYPTYIVLRPPHELGGTNVIERRYAIGSASITPIAVPEPSEYGLIVGMGLGAWTIFRLRGRRLAGNPAGEMLTWHRGNLSGASDSRSFLRLNNS